MFLCSLCVSKREGKKKCKKEGKIASTHARMSRTGSQPVNVPLGFSWHQLQCANTERWSVAENIWLKRSSTASFLFSHWSESHALHVPLCSCVFGTAKFTSSGWEDLCDDVTLPRRALQLIAVVNSAVFSSRSLVCFHARQRQNRQFLEYSKLSFQSKQFYSKIHWI